MWAPRFFRTAAFVSAPTQGSGSQKGRNIEAVIPTTISRRRPIPYDVVAYRRRNTAERLWARLKDFRRVATRYDKLAANFLAGVQIAALVAFWLK